MKHRGLSLLLALTFLVSVFMFCTTAFAATGAQDGVTAELTTDKTDYVSGEVINVSLVVTNSNVNVYNVRTELILPEGATLTTGALVSDGVDLAAGASAAYSYGATVDSVETPTTQAPTTQAPTTGEDDPSQTGDVTLFIYGALAIVSLAGLVVLAGAKNIFKQRWFILVLCCALLAGVVGPVAANAATTTKTFEVATAVTMNGTAAEVKAVITYDLDDGVIPTEEVAFKQGGEYLWALTEVEQGYYLPSDISYNGQTTTKNGDYRPEVNAPYIDMLFGCTNKNGAAVAGEFTVDIFSETAQQSALIGLTDDPASKAALELIDEDEWIITVIDGKLVVTGWYDNATAAAARALYALGSAEADDIVLNLPMIGKMSYVDVDMPAVSFGNFVGGMDSDFGAVVLRWNEVVADDFDTYCAALEAAGYTLRESNTMDGFKQTTTLEFATYVKGDDAILVQYLPVSLLTEDPDTLTAVELKAYEAAFSADGDAIRLILSSTDLLGTTAEENTGWTDLGITPKVHSVNLYNKYGDGNSIGQCEIFTLADGSFIVVDGGYSADAEQLYRTLSYMNERPDGKIVIAAWFFTHDHGDHTACLSTLANSEWASEITVEQVVLNHCATSYSWRTKNAPYGYALGWAGNYANIRNLINKFAQGEDYQLVMPHMGQVMYIRNAEIEILTVGDEDVYPVIFNNDNAQSLVFRVTFPGVTIDGEDQSVLILGDSALDQTYNVYFPLMCGELYADILQVAHHGLGGQTSRFYPMISGIDVSIWPTDNATISKNGLFTSSTNSGLQIENGGTTKLNIVCDEYVHTLELPFDVSTDHVLRTKIGTFKTKFQDAEMDITMLPASRFQKQWNNAEAQAKIIDYLKEYTSDLLILPLIDQNSAAYNNADLVNGLYEALDYHYVYYAHPFGIPPRDATGNFENGDNTMGHLILSTYPILDAETGILVEGNTTAWANPEGRGYAHVLLDVEGVEMDVVATHFDNNGNWAKFAEMYEQWGQYTIIAGNTKIKGDVTAAGIELSSAAFDTDVTILGSEGITFVDSATDSRLATEGDAYFVNKNMSAIYTTTATFSLYTAPEVNENPVRQGFMNWWVNSWGGSYDGFEKTITCVREQNMGVVALHQISNSTAGVTLEQILAESGYEYAHYVEAYQFPNGGKNVGHIVLSHYPIEVMEDVIISDGSDDLYNEGRAFGHVVVTINGTAIDLWYGNIDGSAAQLAKIEAEVNKVAAETGRPFIFSSNDITSLENATSFAGYEVQNYYTPYVANVLVSTGKVTVTKAEAVAAPHSGGGVDDMNILDLDVEMAPAILNWWAGNWGGSNASFETIMEDVRAQDIPIVTFQQINNGLLGCTAAQVASEAGYENFHYVDCFAKDDGTFNGHMILSHYPIEVQETVVLRAIGSTEGESRTFGHVIVDINGTKTDVYFGATDWLSADHLAALEAVVAEVASETGRPFIVSGNDMPTEGLTSFAGVEVYNYRTSYVSAVLVSKGALNVTKAELLPAKAAAPAVDNMNVIWFETTGGALTPGDPYEPPVVEEPEEPVGEQLTIKVANLPTFRFGGKYNEYKDTIDAILAGYDADILGLTLVDQNSTRYNNTDVPAQLAAALGYEYSYFAPVWTCDTDGNGGTVGHMIFSKYEIVFSEVIQLVDGSDPAVEGRGAVHIVVKLNETTTMDVYATGFENSGNWTTFAEKFNNQGDYFLIMGNTKVTSAAEVEAALGVTGVTASRSHNRAHYASAGATFSNAGTDNAINTQTGIPNPNECHYADLTVTLNEVEEPVATETVSFINWWGVGFAKTADASAAWLADPANHTDIALLSHTVGINAEQAAALAEAAGYAHHCWISSEVDGSKGVVGHLLMSDYPITLNDTLVLVEDAAGTASPEGRTFGYATVDVNGTPFDVFFGENNSGQQGSLQNQETVEPWVNEHVAAAGNAYVVSGYNFTNQTYPAFTSENYTIVSNSGGSILAPASVAMANQGTITAGLGGDEPAYAELTFAAKEAAPKEVSLKLMSWGIGRMNGNDVYADEAARWAELLKVIVAEDADIIQLHCVKGEAQRDVILADLAATYPHYVYVPGSENNSQMLLSKYPITSTDTAQISTGTNEVRVAGHSIVDVDGAPVELYYAHLNSADKANEAAAMVTAFGLPTNDAWFVMGAFHGLDISGAVGEAVASAATGSYTIYAPTDTVAMTGSKNTTCEYGATGGAFHADACILAEVTFTVE